MFNLIFLHGLNFSFIIRGLQGADKGFLFVEKCKEKVMTVMFMVAKLFVILYNELWNLISVFCFSIAFVMAGRTENR